MSERFDALSRGLSESRSRRGALKLIGGAAVAAFGATVLRPGRGDAVRVCSASSPPCGTSCCNRGDTCVSPSSNCCCPRGTTPCGLNCCAKGVACLDASNSQCGCDPGTTPCGTNTSPTCCPAGEVCTSGCPPPSPSTFTFCYGFVCFIGATRVLMADGSERPIEQIEVGDSVLGSNGGVNLVLAVRRPELGDRLLYALNDDDYFVTAEHPFLTTAGWKSIDPLGSARVHRVDATHLNVGDHMFAAEARPSADVCANVLTATSLKTIELTSLRSREDDPSCTVYDLTVDGDHTYFANGFVVHNR